MLSAGVAQDALTRDTSRRENIMTATAVAENESATPSSNQPRLSFGVWFEIPVVDLARATRFYETIFATSLLSDQRFPTMSIFPADKPGVTGCLMTNDLKPSIEGTVVYVNADGQLDAILKRTVAAGGQLLEEVAQLPAGMGWTAQIRDTEGNRIGLHAAY
jgi:hypothetical protein